MLEIIVTSVPDRENLVAEIWYGEKMLAEVSNENNTTIVEIYPNETIRLVLEEFMDVLTDAKKMLPEISK